MVICNIVTERKLENTIKFPSFVNVCTKHWQIINKLPTLIYGHKMAKELYPNDLKIGQRYLRELISWSYTVEELESECWVNEFVDESVEKFLQCSHHSIDVIFDHSNFDVASFAHKLSKFPLIHAGAHEIYVAEKKDDGKITVHSFQMDNLKYAGINPEEFFYKIINELDSKCIIFSTDEIDLTSLDKIPISFKDLVQASENQTITFKEIIATFSPHVKEFKKEMLLAYFLRHQLYTPQIFKHLV